MAPQSLRSAAFLVSVHVDPEANPEWVARITSYRDAFGPPVSLATETSVEGICDVLRDWLSSVIERQSTDGDV